MKVKHKKILHIVILTALSLLTVYLLYGTIGSIVVWYRQPLFTAANGETSRSLGFFIIFIIFGILALLACCGIGLCVWLFFFRKKKKSLPQMQSTEQAMQSAALTIDPEQETFDYEQAYDSAATEQTNDPSISSDCFAPSPNLKCDGGNEPPAKS